MSSSRPDSQPPPTSEQRAYTRYKIWFPVTLEVKTGQIWGICRDVSPKGIMISSAISLDVGDRVRAVFKIEPSDPERSAEASVVRAWRNADELHLAFRYRLALEFDEALIEIEPRLRDSLVPGAPTP